MVIIDTNIILRYILNDHPDLSPEAKEIFLNNDILILTEVVAEAIYVLNGIYKFSRKEIADELLLVFSMDDIYLEDEQLLLCAINEYATTNLDFVDTFLYAQYKYLGKEVLTFDNELKAKLNE